MRQQKYSKIYFILSSSVLIKLKDLDPNISKSFIPSKTFIICSGIKPSHIKTEHNLTINKKVNIAIPIVSNSIFDN